jgi:hypothetical protein
MVMATTTGTVYLLHFRGSFGRPDGDDGYRHARHYLGFSVDLEARLNAHRTGQGARLMEVIRDAGLTFELARTWTGDRHLERRLKHRGGRSRLCPICRKEA